jgi:glycine/D-amino acid oxidase-like deaminating enzyme
MSDEQFLEHLRRDAEQLRFDGDDVMRSRIAARVRERIASQPQNGVSYVLARWLRPVGAALATFALVATLGVQWFEQSRDTPATTLDALTSTQTVDISVGGDTFNVE